MANRVFPYIKSTAPTANDDTGDGYKVGDIWLDTTNDLIYEAIDVTLGAAVWVEFVGRTLTQTLTNKTLTAPTIADFTNAQHDHGDADDGGAVVSASTTVAGVAEIATTAETDTGTDATRTVSPDGLAGSYAGTKAFGGTIQSGVISTGDGKFYLPPIPPALNGMNLVNVIVTVRTTSSSGTPTFQFARGRQANATSAHTYVDMLTTRVTIDAGEYSSINSSAAFVIDTSNDDLATGDIIRCDIDVAGTGTSDALVTFEARLP